MLLQGANRPRVPFWDGDERNVIAVAGVSHLRVLDEFHINRPHFPQKAFLTQALARGQRHAAPGAKPADFNLSLTFCFPQKENRIEAGRLPKTGLLDGLPHFGR